LLRLHKKFVALCQKNGRKFVADVLCSPSATIQFALLPLLTRVSSIHTGMAAFLGAGAISVNDAGGVVYHVKTCEAKARTAQPFKLGYVGGNRYNVKTDPAPAAAAAVLEEQQNQREDHEMKAAHSFDHAALSLRLYHLYDGTFPIFPTASM
jgi:hypothetical protein